MSYNSKYKGADVEDALNKFANGKVGAISAVDTNESVDEPDMNNSINVLDNGNIKVTINGVSKDFMPATPSGDPMHYYYEKVGAEWNDGEDKTLQIPIYGKSSDSTEYMSIVHKSKRWYLNLLGDITNEEMAAIVSYPRNDYATQAYSYCKARTILYTGAGTSSGTPYANFAKFSDIETIYTTTVMYPSSTTNMFNRSKIKYLLGSQVNSYFSGKIGLATTGTEVFKELIEIRIKNTEKDINLKKSSKLSKTSVLYMINEATAKTPVTITFHPTVYANIVDDEEVVSALAAKNESLEAGGGSISIVSI